MKVKSSVKKIKAKKIKAVKNGPLIVENVSVIKLQNGKEYPVDSPVKLCRCGDSLDKPLCDGMHAFFDFDDAKDPYRTEDTVDVFRGEHMTVYENRGVCSHRGICYEDLPQVWKMQREVRIDMSAVDTPEMVEAVIDICRRCPSGALSFSLPGGTRDLDGYPSSGEISLAPRRYGYDGPYEVTGGIEFTDEDGNVPESEDHYALCRCGHSKNMPFCSGDHWRVKFLDENSEE